MRWIAAPLAAAVLFAGAGFVDALARTTDLSAALTQSTEEVPATTREAAAEAADVPTIARLTGQQAASFADLVEALQGTAERVAVLEESLGSQVQRTEDLTGGVAALLPRLGCTQVLLERLIGASRSVPTRLRDAGDSIAQLSAAQRKSLKHLRSINRKMKAFGVAADARGIEAARPPRSVSIPASDSGPRSRSRCRDSD